VALDPTLQSIVVDEDLQLLERWRAGDARAGQDLFTRHFGDIYRFFQHKVGAEADELVQRTFTGALAAREQFRASSSFRTYLFAIARNQLYSFLRQLPRGEHVDFEVTSIAELATSLSSKLGRLQEIEQLRIALARLPGEQQLLLELHYWHELDAAGLAEVFETSAGNIRVRLLRARNALRKELGQIAPSDDALATALSRPEAEET
jgi:RNA polymerase sigma factor (sigma-70 family)